MYKINRKEMINLNLPNKITTFRMLLIPVLIIINLIQPLKEIVLFNYLTLTNILMAAIFLIGAISDFFDGHLARKYNLVTSFGKFMDPLADKLLVFSTLVILLEQNNILTSWVIIVMLAREFMVSGLRMLAADKGQVIAAGMLGKIKTNFQFISIVLLLVVGESNILAFDIINYVMMYLSVFFALWSGIDYIYKGRNIILETK